MAFSFRIGTKWCHDFPKLARESGFYFNMHKSRIRVDWNRISNIDVDQIIRERDFYTIDDNVNSVIDYCLESEYDVKILDPNFVKLFRLAQLSVEYLLYCKQYLDHSVVILKDELKSKIEENVKLKKEIVTLEETMKHLKEKSKDRSKLIETKIGDSNGEIYKCPYCPKTFISSVFVSAHIIRRHAYTPDLCITSSPVHEHYRNETERLHNEIKSLKERLNETERVIRNDSERMPDRKIVHYDRRLSENEIGSFKYDINRKEEHQEYKGYQEEIKTLKTMLFDEIHNLRQKEKTMNERSPETNVQALMNQQEQEFQKLRNQLFEKLTPDIESMQTKLYAQEDYWKSKIEHLEKQHQQDVEKLMTELKLTQKTADDMKAEYESKVNHLERETANQSNILIEQSKQLHSLSHEINVSLLNEKNKMPESTVQISSDQLEMLDQSDGVVKNSNDGDLKQTNTVPRRFNVKNVNKAFNSDLFVSEIFPVTVQHKTSRNVHTLKSERKATASENKIDVKHKTMKAVKSIKVENKKNAEMDLKYCSVSDTSQSQESFSERELDRETKHSKYDSSNRVAVTVDSNESDINKSRDAFVKNVSTRRFLSTNSSKDTEMIEEDITSETNSEPVVSEESETHSESESITIIQNNSPAHKYKRTKLSNSFYKKLQESLQDKFIQRLKDLGIDPEWQGIPKQTFKQKMDILKHHEKITVKKLPKYHQIKSKIIQDVCNKISRKEKVMENCKHIKKSTEIKTIGARRNSDGYTPTLQTQNVVQSKEYCTPENYSYIKNRDECDSSPVRFTKPLNRKSIENLIQVSSNSLTSLEDVKQSTSVRRDSLNRIKFLFRKDNADETNVKNISMSSKLNKSVLKSAIGSTSSLTKKKVIFDLTDKEDEESLSAFYVKKENLNDNNWNFSSTPEKQFSDEQENYRNTNNIVLKTTQSDKIAEISKKLEMQLKMVRQKPVGSIEAMFSPKQTQDTENNGNDSQQLSSSSISSLLESSLKASTNDTLPQPAPRTSRDKITEILRAESISEVSDLDSDIDRILKLE